MGATGTRMDDTNTGNASPRRWVGRCRACRCGVSLCGIACASPCRAQGTRGSGPACPGEPVETLSLRLSAGHFPVLAEKKNVFFLAQ